MRGIIIIRSVIFCSLLMSPIGSSAVLVTSKTQLLQLIKERDEQKDTFKKKLVLLSFIKMIDFTLPVVAIQIIHTYLQGPETGVAWGQFLTTMGSAFLPSCVLIKAYMSIHCYGQHFSVWEQIENAIDPKEYIRASQNEVDDVCNLVGQPTEDTPYLFQNDIEKRVTAWHGYKTRNFSNDYYSKWYKKFFDALPIALSKKENKMIPNEIRALILKHAKIPTPSEHNKNILLQAKKLVKVLPFTGWCQFVTLQKKYGNTSLMQWMADHRRLYGLCEADAINFEPGPEYTSHTYYPHCIKKDDSKVAYMYATKYGPSFYLNVNNKELIEFHHHYDWKKHDELVMQANGLKSIISGKEKNA